MTSHASFQSRLLLIYLCSNLGFLSVFRLTALEKYPIFSKAARQNTEQKACVQGCCIALPSTLLCSPRRYLFCTSAPPKGEMGMHDTGPRLAAENPCCFMASLKHNKKMMCICSSLIPRPRTASYVLEVTEHMYNHRLASALEQALGNVWETCKPAAKWANISLAPCEISCRRQMEGSHFYCIQMS